MVDGAKLQLKQQILALKKDLGLDVKIVKLAEAAAFPISIQFTCQGESVVDLYELQISLIIDGFDYKVSKVGLRNEIPRKLSAKIEERLQKDYLSLATDCQWNISRFAEKVINNYNSIVSCCPEMLEMYMGEGADGQSLRRYAILDDTPEKAQSDHEQSEEENSEDERARLYWQRKKEEEEEELIRQKAREAEEKRQEFQNDPSLHAKVKILSIKEQKELREAKNKQGVRMAKTASKKKKFDPSTEKERK